ncbi:hypothetical protein FIU87_10370 [Bacillus sp. THAF10]|uniref:YndM family protein n=1 Tax=Bacillus sp. THAF10 TaxID=2587848 RepID=UPI0012A80B2F|nr:YndM family protein [Bacillus sp. THAF10]QFT89051.1 hypothetical protein FIU87_10370 [Bacillus sp. THAF10]
MKHFLPVVIKFIVSFLVLGFFLFQYIEISFLDIVLATTLLVLFSYLIGDNLVLPKTNYTIAAVFDFVLTLGTIASMVYVLTNLRQGILLTSLFAAAVLTGFEIVFHIYLVKSVFPDREPKREKPKSFRSNELQTEFSEELDLPTKNKKED